MSFATKTDLVGLSTQATNLAVKSIQDGATHQLLQIVGADGSYIGDEMYGDIKNPSVDYIIKGAVSLDDLVLGHCYNENYALASLNVSTSAGGEPSFSASAVQIEEFASTVTDKKTLCTYVCPAIDLSQARHALTFGAFTYTQSASLVLNSSTLTCSADISPSTIDGVPVASDSVQGMAQVQATFWAQSNTTEPTITINEEDGWHITTDWAMSHDDSAMPVWTVTLTKYLTVAED